MIAFALAVASPRFETPRDEAVESMQGDIVRDGAACCR